MKTEAQLLDLKKDVESAKNTTAELTGQLKGLKKQLQEEWSCKDSTAGDKRIADLLKQIRELDQKIKDSTVELEEKYQL
jgi:DNA-binding FrmR family transcriptional regulator